MMIYVNALQVSNSVHTIEEAKEVVRILQKKIETWEKVNIEQLPQYIRELAISNKIMATLEIKDICGIDLVRARQAVDQIRAQHK